MHVLLLPGVAALLAAFTELLRVISGRGIFPVWGSILYIILTAAMGLVMMRRQHPALGETDGFSKLNLHRSESEPPMPRVRAAELLRLAGAITFLGMIGVALAVVLGFEEAPDGLFLISALCLFAAPIVLFLHLWLTKTMSRLEKRSWLKAFASRRALQAAADYVARQEQTSTAS